MAANPNPQRVPDAIWWLWEQFDQLEATALLSGIVAEKAGYHSWRSRLPASDYSTGRDVADDKQGSSSHASAIDLTMSTAAMKKYTARLDKAARARDLRLYIDGQPILREFIGTLDGRTVYCWVLVGGRALGVGADAGPDPGRDKSHLWHLHLSVIRRFLNSMPAMRQLLSILAGETLDQWRTRTSPKPEEFVMATEAQVRAIIREELGKLVGPAVLDALETARPYQASGPRKRLQDDRVAAGLTPWADQSVRTLLEYGFDAQVNGVGPLLQQILSEVADDPAVPVTLDQAQIAVLAEQVSARMPTAASVARAVNDDAAQRMQS